MSERAWLKSYPAGTRWDAELALTPIQQILDDATAQWPDNPALEFMGKRLTYRQLSEKVAHAAKGLQLLGVGPGVHVGLFLPNSPHSIIAFFGILKAGGTVVNYSPLDADSVLAHKVEDSRTDMIVTLDVAALYPQMSRLLGTTRLKKLIVGNIAEMTAMPAMVKAHMAGAKMLVEVPSDERHMSFEALLANDGEFTAHPIADPTKTVAVLQYTGGTTGLPKGAMLTHGNLTAASSQYVETAKGDPPMVRPGQERMLLVLPLFHIYALTANMLFGLQMGAELVLHARFEVEPVVKDLVAKKITIFLGVPTMFAAILASPGVDKLDLSALSLCSSGGAPLPTETADRFKRLTGSDLTEGWGMTETSPSGTFTPRGGRKAGSCGIPVPGAEIEFVDIVDPTRRVARGERGEIVIRGPNVMLGYWNNAAATAEAMTQDGFLRTGDVGIMDEDGYVFIVDRIKDMLLCGGYNVYPRNIEEAVAQHPAVMEVSVIGIDDAYRGQSPKAYVSLNPGAQPFTLEELKAFLKDKLGKHEMVQALEIRSSLPKTPVGKLSKKALYDELKTQTAAA